MRPGRGFFTNRLYRFFTAVIITWTVFIAGSVMLVLWACMPENNTLFVLAVAAWIWVGIIIFYSQYRTVSRYIYPLEKIDSYAARVASGKFPQPLTTANTGAECYRELISALNLMRDKLRYLNNHCQQLQQKKQENIRDMNRTNSLNTRLMAMLAADMRRPLNAVNGYANLTEKGPAEQREKFFAGLKRNLEETELLLSHMDMVSVLAGNNERGKEAATFETGSFIHQLLECGRESMREQNITLSARFSSDLPPEMYADRDWLFKILMVLMHVTRVNTVPGGNTEFSCDHSGYDIIFRFRTSDGLNSSRSLAELYDGQSDNSDAVMERDLLALLFIGNQAHSMNAEFTVSDFGSSGTELLLVMHDAADGGRFRRHAPNIRMASQKKNRPDHSGEGKAPEKMLLVDSDPEMAEIVRGILPETEVTYFAGAELLPEDSDLQRYGILVLEIDRFREAQMNKAESIMRRAMRNALPVIVILNAPDSALEEHFTASGAAGVLSKVVDCGEFSALVRAQSSR